MKISKNSLMMNEKNMEVPEIKTPKVKLALFKMYIKKTAGSDGIVIEMVTTLDYFSIHKITNIIKNMTLVIYWKT